MVSLQRRFYKLLHNKENPKRKRSRLSSRNKTVSKDPARNVDATYKNVRGVIFLVFGLILLYGAFFYYQSSTINFRQVGSTNEVETPWVGSDRLLIMLIGLDKKEGGFSFVDYLSIILFDPEEKEIHTIDINVNTYVFIPSKNDFYQIRSLYNLAEFDKKDFPLVYLYEFSSSSLSAPVDRYIVTDIESSQAIFELMGEITVSNEKDLFEPDNKLSLKKGSQKLSSRELLKYVAVDADSPNTKIDRQNSILSTLFDRSISFWTLVHLVSNKKVLENSIYSDIHPREVRTIINFLRSNPEINLDGFYDQDHIIAEGKMFLAADAVNDKITKLFFYKSLVKERARIEIFNGTTARSLSLSTGNFLKTRGFDVIRNGNAGGIYPDTIVYVEDREAYSLTLNLLEETMPVKFIVKSKNELPFISTGDIVIVLGSNYIE